MRYFFLYLDDAPVAFLSFLRTSEIDLFGRRFAVDYIYELQVCKEHQGRRLGSRLLHHLERHTKTSMKHPMMMLTCFKKNVGALEFYGKHGFKPAPTSLSQCDPHNRDPVDYEILSKRL